MPSADTFRPRCGPRRRFWLRWPLARAFTVVCVSGLTLISTGALLPTPASAGPTTSTSSVGADQAQEAQLESRIAQQGAVVQNLVAGYDQAQAHEALVQAQLSAAQLHLSIDRIAQSKATAVLRRIALDTYMSGADSSSIMGLFEGGNAASVVERQEYTGLVGAKVARRHRRRRGRRAANAVR